MVESSKRFNGSNVDLLVARVRRDLDISNAELGEAYYPAHLTVALLDAILNPQLNYERRVVPIIERYCVYFKLQRVRPDPKKIPPECEQETLSDLIGHYEAMGMNGFQDKIIQSRYVSPGTNVLKAENIKNSAVALRRIGIETLQDVQERTDDEIKRALTPLRGIGDRTVHIFLMYVGRVDHVKGDLHIKRFVTNALGRRVSAKEAEELVREAAWTLGIDPRSLDYEIWKFGSTKESPFTQERNVCSRGS